MTPTPLQANLLTFAPESWGEVGYFAHFYAATFTLTAEGKKCLPGIKAHFEKTVTITHLLGKLGPGLSIDNEQLRTNGFTAAENSREFTAVAEGVFTELYSTVDCARKVITDIFRGCRRMPGNSTRKLFAAIAAGTVGPEMPDAVKAPFRNASWYPLLRQIRDDLTHADTGHARLDDATNKVVYTHFSIKVGGRPLVIPDFMNAIADITAGVNTFLGELFGALNAMLRPTHSDQLCGFFNGGSAYMRRVPNERPITFHSGVCLSRQWYDQDPTKLCPFSAECDAYSRALSPGGSTSHSPRC